MILIDMKMPCSCYECKLAHDDIYCSVTHKSILDQRIDFRKERLPECPIIGNIPLETWTTEFLCECLNEYDKNNRPT